MINSIPARVYTLKQEKCFQCSSAGIDFSLLISSGRYLKDETFLNEAKQCSISRFMIFSYHLPISWEL